MVIDPNIKSSTGSNALHSACIASHDVNITEMVELLIERYYHSTNSTLLARFILTPRMARASRRKVGR